LFGSVYDRTELPGPILVCSIVDGFMGFVIPGEIPGVLPMPSRAPIKLKVLNVIAAIAHRSKDSVQESQTLDGDLGLGGTVRAALAVPFTRIAREYPEGKRVTILEARALKTVQEAIDLVHARANGVG
jgi:hypothetical protein